MTNFEKIKAMSVEEMAKWFDEMSMECENCPAIKYCTVDHKTCEETIQGYLESEVEEDG